ncbi:MAG: hypothetical protein KBC83_02315 [Candidatus Moranbacteria bacterium]|nr:hypothetical protein [Candidatus Moranbacteria bacterium]MBP9801481.1 hypothetical protein [Candidatus Moranbacteria bacterium]
MNYGVLLDCQTSRVLAVSSNYPALVFVKNCTQDTLCSFSVDWPSYKKFFFSDFFLISEKPESLPNWVWDWNNRIFKETKPDLVSELLIKSARLSSEKLRVINSIMRMISVARFEVSTGVMLQESVYTAKRMQASEFKRLGYNEDLIADYPYVFQYADFLESTFQQAADEILLKAKFDDDLLAKTELLRLIYFDKVKKADSIKQLQPILDDFIRVSFTNALV